MIVRWVAVVVVMVVVSVLGGSVRGLVIPPPWVNQTTNPCATQSWQLLYWPQDGSCHRIFTQGPCGESQEFYYDVMGGKGRCRCPRGSLLHSDTQRCFPHHSRGPCPPRQYLDRIADMKEIETIGQELAEQWRKQDLRRTEQMDPRLQEEAMKEEEEMEVKRRRLEEGVCTKFGSCPAGQVFWPLTQGCYQYHTRGPCLNGALLYINPTNGMPECGCERSIMFSNFWPLTGLCFELFQRGPCPTGHIFLYNATRGVTECGCSTDLVTNYHTDSGGCYELDQQGPCSPGHVFTFQPSTMAATCICRPDHGFHAATGACHRLYTRGPCHKGHFFTPVLPRNQTTTPKQLEGQCQVYPCSGPRRYYPTTDTCHRLGWRGPCQSGRLFIYHEDAPLVGECGCLEELAGYWHGDGRCYEVGSRGPCPPSHILAYSKSSAASFCACDLRKGFVKWQDGQCYRLDTRGPCDPGQILVLPRGSQLTPACITSVIEIVDDPPSQQSNIVMVDGRHLHHNTTAPPPTTTPYDSEQGAVEAGQGRSGRSMGDSEVWGGLESLLPPGHYFTGRPDGRRGLTPWWGQQAQPPPTQPPLIT